LSSISVNGQTRLASTAGIAFRLAGRIWLLVSKPMQITHDMQVNYEMPEEEAKIWNVNIA
jgi:hypothetical protein